MFKRILLTILLVFMLWSPCYAQTYLWRYLSSAECTAETTGKARDLCFDTVLQYLYKCVPAAGDCDSAGEWKLIGTVEVDTLNTGDMCTNDGTSVQCTVNTFAELSGALDNQAKVQVSFVITNGDTAIDASVVDPVVCTTAIPNNLKITAWYLDCDKSGDIVIDVWKNTWNDTPLTNTDSIAGTEKPTLSSDVSASDTSLTSMTADWDAGEQVCLEIESAATVTKCRLDFYGYND